MKPQFLVSAGLAATLFVLTLRGADDATSSNQVVPLATPATIRPQMSASDAEILKRYDKNGDGKLDDDEVAAAMEANRKTADTNREKMRDQLKERQQAWLKEFDKDGDGKLDAAECAAMEKTLRGRLEKIPRMLKRFDTDGDGKLSDSEWAAAREKILVPFEKSVAK